MASEILPVNNLAQIGLVQDTPNFAIPINAFTTLNNVRLTDGAIRKIEGEINGLTVPEPVYVAWWPAPSLTPDDGYYVVIEKGNANDTITLYKASDVSEDGRMVAGTAPTGGNWQHTLFSGGYAIVLNNGKSVPRYIIEPPTGTPTAYELPGWESYRINEPIVDVTYGGFNPEFNLGFLVDFDNTSIVVNTTRDGTSRISTTFMENGTEEDVATVTTETVSNTTSLAFDGDAIEVNDLITISLISTDNVQVTAGVVRAYGDLLVAGNLQETAISDNTVLRELPGVVRTSDVAPAGSIPSNWNPFRVGAGTADEFVMSTTGIIQDMVELQGSLMIYTNNSIHSMSPTGNATVPFAIQNITNAYGAQTTNAVLEFDGQHVVLGSNDVYIFPGHPGNIKSISDDRVRRTLFSDIDAANEDKLYMLRNVARDEIWICYPKKGTSEPNKAYIWNYRDNTWVTRDISQIRAGTIAPFLEKDDVNGDTVNINKLRPLFINADSFYYADVDDGYNGVENSAYTSTVERRQFTLTPEFNTESVMSVSLLAQGSAMLDVDFAADDNPNASPSFEVPSQYSFNVAEDYKVDVRLNGRFISFRIKDEEDNTNEWLLTGMQVQFAKGGTR